VGGFGFRNTGRGALQVAQESIAKVIDPTMDRDVLLPPPRVLHDRRLAHMMDLLDDVVLAQPIDRGVLAVAAFDQCAAAIVNILHVPEPIVDESQ